MREYSTYVSSSPKNLLPDTRICAMCMRRECRERFPRHQHQRKPLVSDHGMHHGTWCMSGTLTRGGGENLPGIPGACATLDFTHLARGSLSTTLHKDLYKLSLAAFDVVVSAPTGVSSINKVASWQVSIFQYLSVFVLSMGRTEIGHYWHYK